MIQLPGQKTQPHRKAHPIHFLTEPSVTNSIAITPVSQAVWATLLQEYLKLCFYLHASKVTQTHYTHMHVHTLTLQVQRTLCVCVSDTSRQVCTGVRALVASQHKRLQQPQELQELCLSAVATREGWSFETLWERGALWRCVWCVREEGRVGG